LQNCSQIVRLIKSDFENQASVSAVSENYAAVK